ncbi:hypothetical protein Tco_0582304, partial [Tanacetum coccineum]
YSLMMSIRYSLTMNTQSSSKKITMKNDGEYGRDRDGDDGKTMEIMVEKEEVEGNTYAAFSSLGR